ncbi:unnamed protein product [Macrosiphum euphorbiae]|uniref:C2H2-type domain-containing protein n=1 Tax=Macrosiphum euphorbiae TaxID=13131 RepID=A0AAV0XWQ4_9HEMI|nr:unnamed protein product [Macrosiphum euphorbiae]
MKEIKYKCLVCSSLFDSQLLYSKHACEKHMMKLTTLILNTERAKKYSCPDTANISKLHISTFKKNKKLKSSMYIEDNQKDNKKGTVDAGMIFKYNAPEKSTEHVEEINNSSEANTAAANILSPVQEMKIYHIKGVFCSMCYKSELNYVNELGEENKRLTKSISNTEREIKNSCPDTANISKFHITSLKENQEAESPMHIEVDQQEETDNSSKANTVKQSKSINSHDLTKEEEQQQQQGAKRMKIFECSTHVQLQKPTTHLNKKKLGNHIVTQTAVAKIVPPKKKLYFNCQICSKIYDMRTFDLEQLYKKTKILSTFISNKESEINMSCPHTSNLPIFHSPQQSPGDNQQDKKGLSADSKQGEEMYTFSEANTAAANILNPGPEIKKPVIKGLVCSKCYDG